MILHTVNKAPPASDCLAGCLAAAAKDDLLLLIEDGVHALIPGSPGELLLKEHGEVRVLGADLAARGLTAPACARVIDRDEFVALAARADKVVSWF